MNDSELLFRRLTFEEFQTLVQWAALEGWNPGLEDAAIFWATDPEGFYGYFDKETLIAGGSIVAYDGQFGFMGFFIVHPNYRAKGIGRTLWQQRRDTLLSRLQPDASIGMDGVVAMQPFYQKGGFEIAYRDERYEKTGKPYPINPLVQKVTEKDWEAICALDLECFGVGRTRFLKLWLEASNAKAFQYTDHNHLLGFAVIRPCQTGYKIGPLFAENETVAAALYERCLTEAIDEPVYLDIPVCNEAAVNLVQQYKATYVFECARMYYGKPPKVAVEKVFGITSFELG
ncbi:GNAT family N-acetyltransferase [Flavobacterium sp. IMCC34852]|uniref:GNAT family N-acetyltransferase n=1 Tax=Flavobacterium rivulicola TaxID=2732161 RepID=A0A7Y3VYH5_9FLAO|nr:GNAT family N-acetyltransferase [Flavobacterium sp. IMCC34852]NNT71700.1 GNAT family N-acetyltransferase [Flavobacterium sp. IMCC34852]